jgi:hypothetical protein
MSLSSSVYFNFIKHPLPALLAKSSCALLFTIAKPAAQGNRLNLKSEYMKGHPFELFR